MLIKTFYREGPSIMTLEDLREMANLADEYESNCYVQCKLVPIFNEIGLVVVNSERPGFDWLQTLSGVEQYDKRPDLIIVVNCSSSKNNNYYYK